MTCPRHGRAQQQQRPGYIAAQSAWQRARYRPTHLSAWFKTTGNGYFRKKNIFVIIFQIEHEPAEIGERIFDSNKDLVFDDKNTLQHK